MFDQARCKYNNHFKFGNQISLKEGGTRSCDKSGINLELPETLLKIILGAYA